jgi:hypothetical protein
VGYVEVDALAGEAGALRFSGRCIPYLPNTTSASRLGPARPRAIGWNGAGTSLIASQHWQDTFSTNQRAAKLILPDGMGWRTSRAAKTAGTAIY